MLLATKLIWKIFRKDIGTNLMPKLAEWYNYVNEQQRSFVLSSPPEFLGGGKEMMLQQELFFRILDLLKSSPWGRFRWGLII